MHDLGRAPSQWSLMAIKLNMECTYDQMSWHFGGLFMISISNIGGSWTVWKILASPFTFWWMVHRRSTFIHRSGFTKVVLYLLICSFYMLMLSLSYSEGCGLGIITCALLSCPWSPASLSSFFFANGCLLIGWSSLQNAKCFTIIVESYYHRSSQLVNLQKTTIIFSPRTKGWMK